MGRGFGETLRLVHHGPPSNAATTFFGLTAGNGNGDSVSSGMADGVGFMIVEESVSETNSYDMS